MPELRSLVTRFTVDLSEFDRGLVEYNRKLENMRREVASKYGELMRTIGGIGRTFTIGVTMPLVGVGAAAINAAMRIDSLERGLRAVAGSSDAAAAQMRALQEVAKLPGLGYEEAIRGAIRLQSAGESAAEATRNLKAFGNALATVGYGKAELEAVVRQLVQMEAKGRVLMQDVRIIQEYVPQLTSAMKAAFGTASTEELEKLGIDAKTFIRGIVTELEKLPAVTGGIRNSFENLTDEITRALATLGKTMLPTVERAINVVSSLLTRFQELPPAVQSMAIKAGVAMVAIGPVLSSLSHVATIGSGIRTIIGWLIARLTAQSSAIAANTVAVAANTAAVSTNITTQTAAAATGAAVVATHNAMTAAISRQTAAVAANTSAWAALKAVLSAPVSPVWMGVAVVGGTALLGGLLYGIRKAGQTIDQMQDELDKNTGRALENFKRTYSKHSTQQLERDIVRQQEIVREAQSELKKYETAGFWQQWQPAEVAKRREAERELSLAQSRLTWLQEELQKRQQIASTQQMITEEAKKAAEENARRNIHALQEKHILSQSNEHEREIASAWVEFVRKRDEINARAREAYQKYGITLDVTQQIRAAELELRNRMSEIRDERIRAAQEAVMDATIAYMEVRALNARNQYERERIQAVIDLARTLQSLKDTPAYDMQFNAAVLRFYKQFTEVTKRERLDKYAESMMESIAGARTRAIESGNELMLANIEEFERFFSTAQTLLGKYEQGFDVSNRMLEAQTRFRHALTKNAEEFAKRQSETAVAEYEKQFSDWRELVTALGEQYALRFEMTGDTRSAEIARMNARLAIESAEAARRAAEAKTPEQQRLASVLQENAALERQKRLFEILTGGVQTFFDRLRERKREAVRGWEEMRDAAISYYENIRSKLTVGSFEEAFRREMEAGLRTSVPMPILPAPPGMEITQSDIEAELMEMSRQNVEQTDLLRRIAAALESLVPIPGWGGA
jgi:tape measure domain-containing protein